MKRAIPMLAAILFASLFGAAAHEWATPKPDVILGENGVIKNATFHNIGVSITEGTGSSITDSRFIFDE